MRAAASPLVFALALSACLPELHDVEGKACDSANPCPSPLTCQAGVCRSGASGGGSGGGQGGAGGGRSGGGGGASGGGGGSAADAGRIVWRQARDGFDGIRTVSCGGCGIDAGQRDAGNVVWAHVPGAGVMRVVAYTGDQGQIPPVTRGRFKGRFRVPASAFPGGNSGFACVASQTASFVINLFLQTNHLGVYSGPGVVADAQSTDVATPSLSADTWYTVEVAWQQGVSRDLWLDGVKVAHVTGSTITVDAGATVVPAEFRLGINSYNGTSGGPWSVELRDFTYSDDPDAALP